MQVKFRKIHPEAKTPKYQTEGSSGLDLHAMTTHTIHLQPGVRFTCPTGIAIELPEGYEAQVRSRSGLASKHGVVVLNSPGTVDNDYTGELKVILINHGEQAFTFEPFDRIAQLVIAPVAQAELVQVGVLAETERGDGGMGSTGV